MFFNLSSIFYKKFKIIFSFWCIMHNKVTFYFVNYTKYAICHLSKTRCCVLEIRNKLHINRPPFGASELMHYNITLLLLISKPSPKATKEEKKETSKFKILPSTACMVLPSRPERLKENLLPFNHLESCRCSKSSKSRATVAHFTAFS